MYAIRSYYDLALESALREAKFVVVQDLFQTATADLANVVLPAQAYTERDFDVNIPVGIFGLLATFTSVVSRMMSTP